MQPNLAILAEVDPAKFIGIAVVVVIWIVGLITQAIKKQQEEKAQQRPEDLPEEIRRRLPRVLTPPNPQQKQRQQKPPKPAKQKAGRPDWNTIAKEPGAPAKQKRRPAPPPIVQHIPEVSVAPVVQTMSQAREAMTGEAAPKQAIFVDARALRRFMNPKMLQQQYILTELLQRPMCDRESPH